MGLFKSKEVCSICNTGEREKPLADGWICESCIQKGRPFLPVKPAGLKTKTVEDIKLALAAADKNRELLDQFQSTKTFKGLVSFDDTHKMLRQDLPKKYHPFVVRYEDIISYELIEDGESITKGGVGSALVGGALSGGVGAITGGIVGKRKTKKVLNQYGIKVVTRFEYAPWLYINLLTTGPVKAGSTMYNIVRTSAQSILTTLAVIMDALNQEKEAQIAAQQPGNAEASQAADAILKFKALLDQGVITEEEFEAKKQQLLGL